MCRLGGALRALALLALTTSLTVSDATEPVESVEVDETALIQTQVQVDIKQKKFAQKAQALTSTAAAAQPEEPLRLMDKMKDWAGAVHNVLNRSPGSFVHSRLALEAPAHGPAAPRHEAPLARHLATRPWEVRTAAKILAKNLLGPSTKDHL